MTDFRVFVTGSRNWLDPTVVWSALDAAAIDAEACMADAMIVVHGGATGADEFAHIWCDLHPAVMFDGKVIPVIEEIHRPNWGRLGKSAGFVRNAQMAKRQLNLCLAFIRDNSKGATHALGCAERAGVLTRVWRVDSSGRAVL